MMMHGIFYKCAILSTFNEASKQFKFEEESLSLLKEYKGGDPFESRENIEHFFSNLKKPVPQCKLCNYYTVNPPGNTGVRLLPTDPLKPKPTMFKP